MPIYAIIIKGGIIVDYGDKGVKSIREGEAVNLCLVSLLV